MLMLAKVLAQALHLLQHSKQDLLENPAKKFASFVHELKLVRLKSSVESAPRSRCLFIRDLRSLILSLHIDTARMRVVEIVIDGFKSYAIRTVISGWDESFNSITGLNGSGKSNILDAICFVLGITSMSTVRAQNIQASQLL